ncbi:MAG: hypothetical protein ACE5EZ_05260 [Thermodesulfobacteriota bacterium]
MKRFLAVAIVATVGLFYSGTSYGAATNVGGEATAADGIEVVDITSYAVGTTANGVAGSRHNLGALARHVTTRDNSGNQLGTTQICVFCHTPHHSNTNAKPLWNRDLSNSATYNGYGSTIAGTTVTAPAAGSASLACLSCHDGVTTFDSLVNAPGKDLGMPGTSWTFFDEGSPISGNVATFSARINIGTELNNDHPINVAYSENKASLRPKSTVIGDIDLTLGLSNTTAYYNWVTENKWAVSGFISSTASISDILRSDNTNSGLVECSSCHDPHFSNGSYPEYTRDSDNTFTGMNVADGVFLRRVGGNMGSGVCRTCHNK